MFLNVYYIKQYLKNFTAFLTKSNKSQILPKQNMVRTITTLPQALVPTSVLVMASIAVKNHNDYKKSYKKVNN